MRKLFSLLLIIVGGVCNAANNDRLILKAGKSVEGFISCQVPGKQIIFQSDGQSLVYDFSEVVRIERSQRDKDIITGMRDVVETRNGSIYRGEILVQELGKWIQISTTAGLKTINNPDILRQRKEVINNQYTLFEQVAYIDVVKTKDNREYTGVITLQNYGNDSISSYLEVTDDKGNVRQIKVKDIEQLRRKANKEYKEIRKIKLGEDEFLFNKKQVKSVATALDKKGRIFIPTEYVKAENTIEVKDNHLIIQMKDTPENRQLIFIKVSEEKIGNNHIYVFTYENLVKGINIPEKSILEPENALTNTYHVSAGVYVLYHQKTSKVNICKIVIK